MKVLILITLLFISICSFSQKFRVRKAEEAYAHKEYLIVIKQLNKIRYSDLSEYQKLLRAEAYRNTHQYKKALHSYENLDYTVLNEDSVYLNFAQVLQTNGQYDKAKKYYKLYLKKHPDHILSILNLNTCEHLKELNSAGITAVKNRCSFNTDENDLTGFMYDGQLVFSSGGYSKSIRKHNWDGEHFLDYYTSKPVSLFSATLNSRLHEGPGFYDTLRNKLYFTRNAIIHTNYAREALSNLKIYESSFENNRWLKPIELSFNDEKYSRGHPASLPGMDYLIFSSNQDGGVGKADLYIVYKENGKWNSPINLGNIANTEGNELFPFLANDSTLYFASDGHGGYGGLDLFRCELKHDKVINVENLGSSFNSTSDDFGLIFRDKERWSGYYCSDKEGGLGSSDIYEFTIQKNNKVIRFIDPWLKVIKHTSGNLAWEKTNKTIKTNSEGEIPFRLNKEQFVKCSLDNYFPKIEQVNLDIKDTIEIMLYPEDFFTHVSGHLNSEDGNEPVKNAEIKVDVDDVVYKGETDDRGDFDILLPKKSKYVFEFKKDGFLSNQVMISDKKEKLTPKIQKVEKGTILKLENIYYEFDKDHITLKAQPILKELIKIMELNPELEIEVSSHADSRGSSDYNKDLSLRRAKSVIDYLEEHDISIERLSVRYYGENKLVNDCGDDKDCLEAVHSKNRRTEFKVLKF